MMEIGEIEERLKELHKRASGMTERQRIQLHMARTRIGEIKTILDDTLKMDPLTDEERDLIYRANAKKILDI